MADLNARPQKGGGETPDVKNYYVRRDQRPNAAFALAPTQVFQSADAAYRAALDALPGLDSPVGGYKLGGTNAATRRVFGVESLYFGALAASEIRHRPTHAPGAPLCELKGEIEIALRIGSEAAEGDDAQKIFDAWAVAVEMPASPIENLQEAGVNALVADRCGAGALVLGEVRPISELSMTHQLRLQIDGVEAAAGSVNDLLGSPFEIGRAFIGEARVRDFPVQRGLWIATGGVTPCVAFHLGARVTVTCDGRLSLAFTVAIEEAGVGS